MNVVIQVNGRDAIPVRAIPFLTSWQKFSPDVLAAVLAQFEEPLLHNGMHGLTAFRKDDDGVCAIPAYWWSSFTYRELCALSDAIRAKQETQKTGYQEWREQSIRILPAGVFVWRDEFEAGYARTLDRWQRVAGAVLDSLVLNLRPDIPPKYSTSLILEGFNTQEPDNMPTPERQTQTPAPVQTAGTPGATVVALSQTTVVNNIVVQPAPTATPAPAQEEPITHAKAGPDSPGNVGKPESKDERVVRWADWFFEEKRINERGAYARVVKREKAINPNAPDRRTIERAIVKEIDRRAREEHASKVWQRR